MAGEDAAEIFEAAPVASEQVGLFSMEGEKKGIKRWEMREERTHLPSHHLWYAA